MRLPLRTFVECVFKVRLAGIAPGVFGAVLCVTERSGTTKSDFDMNVCDRRSTEDERKEEKKRKKGEEENKCDGRVPAVMSFARDINNVIIKRVSSLSGRWEISERNTLYR